MQTFDYIVVGAGSAGCVLADRLTANGRRTVLLLEAGPDDKSFWLRLPIGYGKSYYDPHVNWMYRSEPIPALADRSNYYPRGKVLGGSSSINAMIYSRGHPGDYDDWAALGNPGWSWRDVLPVYRRMEDHALGESAEHGVGGPLHITDIAKTAHPLCQAWLKAGQEAGLALNPDLNGATIEGIGLYQLTTRNGIRESTARAYLDPARRRRNLEVATDALAERILFDGRRATGVRYGRHGRSEIAQAGREIIVATGSINTPQLLQLSGIGPVGLLRDCGIEVLHANENVGAHLQDHLCYDHVYRANRPTLNDQLLPWSGRVRVALQYLLTRSGPLSLSVNQGGGFFRANPDSARPDMQLYFSPLSYERAQPGVRALMQPDPFSGFCTSISPCRPTSRGWVRIRSADPHRAPAIEPNMMATDEDVAALLAGAHFLRRLAATPAFKSVIDAELKPGPDTRSNSELVADVRQRAYSVFHPVGTCRMGPDARDSVVDPTLKVHGIGGLRVVDASIFPTVTSGNTNAPAIMVGEKGAELVLRDSN